MTSFLCSRSVHRWEHSKERYYIANEHGRDNFILKIRVCKGCKKRQAYTMVYALENKKKHWKDWDKKDGDYITWQDLDC
jgi:hypothetical protein